ncbi:2TM domain-containing protein [Photobacterium sp. J15]|uniref:2TM domain-containing protein n=1 Tax=Photobacterium sp. J15 TaxID=265901 RepID=UPI0007E2F087|nr:2TM domain-containing protein [Photobacterium sp. J15]
MKLRKLRLSKAWSQEQLAEMTGLSVRTIQRIERGQKASFDSLKSLAAVFDVHVNELQEVDCSMDTNTNQKDELAVVEYVRDLKGFYSHLTNYLVVIFILFLINLLTDSSYIWAIWPALGWGIGVLNHAAHVYEWFNWFNERWEKKQIEKRLGRRL